MFTFRQLAQMQLLAAGDGDAAAKNSFPRCSVAAREAPPLITFSNLFTPSSSSLHLHCVNASVTSERVGKQSIVRSDSDE